MHRKISPKQILRFHFKTLAADILRVWRFGLVFNGPWDFHYFKAQYSHMTYNYTSYIPDRYSKIISVITHNWHKRSSAVIELWYKLITDLKNEFSITKSCIECEHFTHNEINNSYMFIWTLTQWHNWTLLQA